MLAWERITPIPNTPIMMRVSLTTAALVGVRPTHVAEKGRLLLLSAVHCKLLLKLNAGFWDPALPELPSTSGYARLKTLACGTTVPQLPALRLIAPTKATPDDEIVVSGYDGCGSGTDND